MIASAPAEPRLVHRFRAWARAWVDRESWSIALLGIGLLVAPIAGGLVVSGNSEIALLAAVAIPTVVIILRWPIAALLLYLLVVPFFVSRATAELGPVMWAFHRLLPIGTLILVALYHAFGIRTWSLRPRLIDAVLVVFIVAGIANVFLLAPAPVRMAMSFYDKLIVPIIFFWLVRAIGLTRADVTKIVAIGVVTILVQASIGVMSWAAPSLLPAQWLGRAGERTVGTFGGPAPYTITLVFFSLLLVYVFVRDRYGILRSLVPLSLALAGLAVFLSLSRGSWLGALVAGAGLAAMYPRQVARFAVVGTVVAGVAIAGPFASQASQAAVRLEDSDTVTTRIITNDAALRMIETRPIGGFGFGQFERFDEAFKRRGDDFGLKLGGSIHNTYLNMGAELGLPLTAAWLLMPAWVLLRSVREWRQVRAVLPGAWLLVPLIWLALADQFIVSNFLEMVHAYWWGTVLWCLSLGIVVTILDETKSVIHRQRDGGLRLTSRPTPGW